MLFSQPRWTLAALALVLGACGPGMQEQDAGFLPAPAAEGARLFVQNDYLGDMDVFAINGSIRTRIGAVPAGGSAQFRIPASLLVRPEIQFQVDPVGPVAPFTYRPIALSPGNSVELAVAPALQMSSYAIVVK